MRFYVMLMMLFCPCVFDASPWSEAIFHRVPEVTFRDGVRSSDIWLHLGVFSLLHYTESRCGLGVWSRCLPGTFPVEVCWVFPTGKILHGEPRKPWKDYIDLPPGS